MSATALASQAPLITKLMPFLQNHRGGLITCETQVEAAASPKSSMHLVRRGGAPIRFGLGSYPEVAGADKTLSQIWNALEADELQYLVVTKQFDRHFLPHWSLWIDLCRWISPLMFTRRLQALCELCVGKYYAEALSFQVLSSQSLQEQLVLCEAIRTRAFQGRFYEQAEDETYRECIEARWAQLLRRGPHRLTSCGRRIAAFVPLTYNRLILELLRWTLRSMASCPDYSA